MLDKIKRGLAAAGIAEFENDEPRQAPQSKPSVSSSPPTQAFNGAASFATSPLPMTPVVDPQMYEVLQNTINSRQTAYTALLKVSESMRSVISDDTQRVKAAFIATSQGRPAADVLRSIDVHIADVDGEKNRFTHSLTQQITDKCNAPRQEAQGLAAKVGTLRQRIEQLQNEIAACQTQITETEAKAQQLEISAANAEREIQAVNDRFTTAVNHVKAELNDRKSQLSTILS